MSLPRMDAAARPLRMLFEGGTITGYSDAKLLERFAGRRDEASELAFALLMERHGPMVLRVCRRVLGDHHDALDAFQATFLVLVRRSRSVRKADSIASWLHGVAYRVASSARLAAIRRRKHEHGAAEASRRTVRVEEMDDLGPLLDRAIDGLPERYRAPLVLCHLEGLTHEQAAEQLGWPVGTIKSRMARGRDRLRERLHRQGFDPTAIPIIAAPPPQVVNATARAAIKMIAGQPIGGEIPASAVTLLKGVVRSMKLKKLQLMAAAVCAAGIVGTTAGVLAQQQQFIPPPVPAQAGPITPAVPTPKEPVVTYDVRFVELTGLAWRSELHDRLKAIGRQGPYTVWAVDEETFREITRRGKVVQAPRVTAFSDAKATISSGFKRTIVTGFREATPDDESKSPEGSPKQPVADTETIPDHLEVSFTGHQVAGGVLVRAKIEGSRIVSIADNPVPTRVASGRQGVGRDLVVQIPEIIQSHFEGEWLAPVDSVLIVGLGVHRLPIVGVQRLLKGSESMDFREQLVAFQAMDATLEIRPQANLVPQPGGNR